MWWETPQFLYYIIAIAVLLSAIITVGLLTKNSELIVMRACGISLYRTALPLIVFAALASGVLFAFEERVLAFSNRRADYLNHIIRGGDSRRPSMWSTASGWSGPTARSTTISSSIRVGASSMRCRSCASIRETLELKERAFATQAVYSPRGRGDSQPWIARAGWSRQLAGPAVTRYTPFDATRLSLEPADYFETEAPAPDRMNFVELRRHIEELRTSGYNVTRV